MKHDMIALLHGEFTQEVPATLETLARWQANFSEPPDGVWDMISLLERFAQAVETVGLDGLAAYLLLIQQFTEGLVADIVAQTLEHDVINADDAGADVALGVIWLGQWVEEALDYLDKPADPMVVERMTSYLSLSPRPFDEEVILGVAGRLLDGSVPDEEGDPGLLLAATDEDVALPTDDVDPELLDALLADASQQLDQLDGAVKSWGDGNCTESEMVEAQRAAHTFKGSGYIIGLPGIGRLAHRIEDLLEYALDGIRSGQQASPAMARDVMQAVYCLQQMIGFLQGEEAAPDHARAVLQRMIDWVGWIRDGEAMLVDPEPLSGPTVSPTLNGDYAESQPSASAAINTTVRQTGGAGKAPDAAVLRVGVTQLNRLLRRAGQSIIHSERLSKLLLDADEWLVAMQLNNQVLANRLRELDLMVNSQVVQLRVAQVDGGDFDPLELDRYDALHGLSRFIGETARDSSALVEQARASTTMSASIVREEGYALVDQHRELLSARMVAVKSIVPRLKRTVAQTASATGRKVYLDVTGEDVAMDSEVLGRLAEPLLHLLRNAVDHGIELPEDRLFVGKAEQGTVRLDFTRVGDEVLLQVSDDGRGLDLVSIENKAITFGLIEPDAVMTESDLHRLILQPGFSTRDAVTETSGRGVGMDIVNDRISGLKGRLEIQSTYGEGSCFTIHVPALSGVAHALIVQSCDESVAIPLEQIKSIVAAGLGEFSVSDNKVFVTYEEQQYPAYALSQWLNLEAVEVDEVIQRQFNWIPVLVHGASGVIALLVDAVLESKELILQDIGRLTRRVPGVIGGALRADGRPLFLLGVTELERTVGSTRRMSASPALRRRMEVERTQVLVVDDAWSVRRSMQQLLEDAGYDVATAADGYEALDRLRAKVPALVITDLEMPNLNGLELARRVKESPQWAEVPVVMITSRTSEKHRAEAMRSGVNVYLTKPYQDAELLAQVRALCARAPEVATA